MILEKLSAMASSNLLYTLYDPSLNSSLKSGIARSPENFAAENGS